MHHIFKIALLLVMSYSLSSAEVLSRIIITKTDKEATLSLIKKRLDTLHVKMYVEKKGNYTIVYSPEYKDLNTAENVLEKLHGDFPYAKILYSQTQEQSLIEESHDFFISLSSGMMNLSSDSNSNESGISYSGGVGYMYTPNIFSTLVYSNTSTDDISMYSIYTSLNYNFNISENFALYTGGVVGYSSLELLNYAESTPSTAIIYGLQLGTSYSLSRYFPSLESIRLLRLIIL